MTDIWLVFTVLGGMVLLFALDRFRLDLVALLALLCLLLSGILTPAEALAGFADPVVLMIAGLFVVGGAIFETGLADASGRLLGRAAGTNPVRLLVLVMLTSAGLSAFLSSTGTVAVMLPVVVSLARRGGVSPSKLLLPLAFSSLLGGMLTLIGTPPNLIVNQQLRAQGLTEFGFFSFTPVGLVMLGVGLVFMLTLGSRLLPARAAPQQPGGVGRDDLIREYGLANQLWTLQLLPTSDVIGQSLRDVRLRSQYGLNALTLTTGIKVRQAGPDSLLRAGDILLVKGDRQAVERFARSQDVLLQNVSPELPGALLLAEGVLPPRSPLLNQSVKDLRFRDRYGAVVLSIKRGGELLGGRTSATALAVGDTLLVAGGRSALGRLKAQPGAFVMVGEPGELQDKPLSARAPWVLAVLVGMLFLMTLGLVANVTAVLLAAVSMVVLRGVSMEGAYRSLNPESLVLIAAVLPLATALSKTGGLDLIVGVLGSVGSEPCVLLLVLFLITSLLSQVISNTATTVLVAPVAFDRVKHRAITLPAAHDRSGRRFYRVYDPGRLAGKRTCH